MQDLNTFIADTGIQMTCARVNDNPNIAGEDWASTHYLCTVTVGELGANYREMQTYFSTGAAHKQPPEVADVLNCLASDACGFESAQSFEDWAAEYGYDTDSRRAGLAGGAQEIRASHQPAMRPSEPLQRGKG